MKTLYLHVKLGDARYDAALAASKAMHKAALPATNLSVNKNRNGTEAIIKIVGQEKSMVAGKQWESAVIAVYDKTEIAAVRKIVNDPAWLPE